MTTTYLMGHLIIWDEEQQVYHYADTGEVADTKCPRACPTCKREETPEGHDPCIPNLPGVRSACCGHGTTEGYIHFNDGRIIRGLFRIQQP